MRKLSSEQKLLVAAVAAIGGGYLAANSFDVFQKNAGLIAFGAGALVLGSAVL